MTLHHIDSVIAFVALMLGLSLLIAAATQFVIGFFGLRGSNLRRSLVDLIETASPDQEPRRHARVIARRVLRDPMISDSVFSRFALRLDGIPFLPPETIGKLQWAGSSVPFLPAILGAVAGTFLAPLLMAVSNRLSLTEISQYSDLIAGYVPILNLAQHPWRTGAIVGAVLAALVSRWRLATSIRVEEFFSALERLSDPLPGTLPDPAQRAMFLLAWSENAPGAKSKMPPAVKPENIVRPAPDFDEGIVRHAVIPDAGGGVAVAVASAAKSAADSDPDSLASAVEETAKQGAAHPEKRLEGLHAWFDHAMDRASQRFTVQARAVAVALSLLFVLAAHLDAIRLFRTLSSDPQANAQLILASEALTKQAEQLSRSREPAHGFFPDVYRKAMSLVLRPLPVVPESPKAKPRAVRHTAAPPPANSSMLLPDRRETIPARLQESPRLVLVAQTGAPPATPVPQDAQEAPAKTEAKPAPPPKPRTSIKEREKSAAPSLPREDRTTMEAKAVAFKALESRPAFASREDAVLWLQRTLDGNTALQPLAAAYEQELNTELSTDADKLLDHAASLKRQAARDEFRIIPEEWPGWTPTQSEIPGLLISLAFLSLGATFLFNALKNLASLRPRLALNLDRERKLLNQA